MRDSNQAGTIMKKFLLVALPIFLPLLAQAQTNEAGSSVSLGAKEFVDQFWSKWSSPNAEALPYIESVIGNTISFYGKPMSRGEYMKAQVAFMKRWPDREYTVQAGSENISCDQTALTCDVSGVVNWKDTSPDRSSISTGAAKFSFALQEKGENGAVAFLLTEESGSVISRNVVWAASNSVAGDGPSSRAPNPPTMTVSVPYVGCTGSDVAGENVAPPPGHPIAVNIPPAIAAKLAFYYGLGLFVLAPRGWECGVSTGATGGSLTSLTVTPHDNDGFSGPVVSLSNTTSDDDGTFIVTAYGGTYFPKLFPPQDVNSALHEYNLTEAQFLAARYPSDRVTYANNSLLEYQTPSGKIGLGPAILRGGIPSNVPPDPDLPKFVSKFPTDGVIGLVQLPDYVDLYAINLLAIRLPPELAALYPAIRDFTAHCQPFDQNAVCASQIDFGQ